MKSTSTSNTSSSPHRSTLLCRVRDTILTFLGVYSADYRIYTGATMLRNAYYFSLEHILYYYTLFGFDVRVVGSFVATVLYPPVVQCSAHFVWQAVVC